MSLEQYAKKRRFPDTPEPPPVAAAPPGRLFCVQRHHARRLHYDLRLEAGGALKSWAVPQGPTLDPSLKRLAVLVEDHPIDYGAFEGNIPKGNYGAGSVMLWDRGTFEPEGEATPEAQIERGDFKFILHGHKLRGRFALVRMKGGGKGNEWLLIKKKDADAALGWDPEDHAWSVQTGRSQEEIARELPPRTTASPGSAPLPEGAVEAPMPEALAPMLASLATEVPAGPDWTYEVKWDGIRALCFVHGGQVRLLGRRGTDFTRQFPELSAAASALDTPDAILDGEIAAPDDRGRPSFARLQPRIMAAGANTVAQLARSRPVTYFAFDLLYYAGHDLRAADLESRNQLLHRILKPGGSFRISEQLSAPPAELMEAVRAQGLEGIVAKRRSSRYQSGRSRDWLKVKATTAQEFVIVGFTEGEREHFGALLLAVREGPHLVFAGSVGTGFDQKLMRAIREKLDRLACAESPLHEAVALPQPVQWVHAELVCTVRFQEWTPDRRLRAPVFEGLRPDVDPSECIAEAASTAPSRQQLLPQGNDEAAVTVEGQRLLFRNLNKVFYPEDGYTKRDLLEYYNAAADLLIPHWKDRPLSLRRYPDGIGREGFFQKDATGMPEWLRLETILAEDGRDRLQVIGRGRADLLYLVHLGCIDQNPWMSRSASLDHPDFVLIDLDPSECGFDRIVEAALVVRKKLDEISLEGFPKTTGGDGMHIYVPLEPVYVYDQTRAFAEVLARLLGSERPDLFTTPRTVGRREKGKVYFDYLQNARGKTISAPYVVRAYAGAPVATPLAWSEVRPGLRPEQFHIRNALARFDATGDLFAPVLARRQRIEPAIERLGQILKR